MPVKDGPVDLPQAGRGQGGIVKKDEKTASKVSGPEGVAPEEAWVVSARDWVTRDLTWVADIAGAADRRPLRAFS